MMNNEATHVKTQEDYSKFSSIVNEFLQEQMNEDFMEKNLLEAGVTSLQMMRISNALRKHGYKISFAKMISDPYVKHWKLLTLLLSIQLRQLINSTGYLLTIKSLLFHPMILTYQYMTFLES